MRFVNTFFEMPRLYKRVVTVLLDVVFILLATAMALVVRIGADAERWLTTDSFWLVAALLPISLLLWVRLGLYRAVIRYLDVKVLTNIVWGALGSAIALTILSFVMRAGLPRSVPFIYFALVLIFVAGSRLVVRGLIHARHGEGRQSVAIYGAGAAGRQLCLALQNGYEYAPVVFFDDSPQMQGGTVLGVRVHSSQKMKALLEQLDIHKVLFAIPSLSKQEKQRIFNRVQELSIEMLTIPSSADLVSGKISVNSLRSVDIQDLLGRDAVEPSPLLMQKCIQSKVVMVTGAGGSIGSELCRQILLQKPAKLILFEQSEYQLYQIERELICAGVDVLPILGSVCDVQHIERVLARFKVDTIYHAAAYKHVPLVEFNVAAGVRNNVWGTRVVAEAALRQGVEHFVLVSTDKAVRPTNIMGASKRLAELVVQDIAAQSQRTVFAMVRFGNVLGSSGSVVPLFDYQISNGGPVTITDKRVTRYFMTVEEAVRLVLMASSISDGNEIFVLDMGKPVKILELAEKMIRLRGLDPVIFSDDKETPLGPEERPHSKSIAIKFVGLRPGEKLHEELFWGDDTRTTKIPRVYESHESFITEAFAQETYQKVFAAIEDNDIEAIKEIIGDRRIGYRN